VPGQPDEGEALTGELEGKYANYFQVGHNAFEFLIDFGQMYSEGTKAQFHTRIITSPSYAKELWKLLGESLNQYQTTFGSIQDAE
jgi:hypothetical protein